MLARVKELRLSAARPFLGGVVAYREPTALDTDMHEAYEMGILLRGQQDRHFEDLVMTMNPGDVWFCGAWEPHGWRAREANTEELVLQFLPSFLGEEMLEGMSWLTVFSAPPSQRPGVKTPEERAAMMALAEELRTEMKEKRRGWLAAVRLGVLRGLLTLSRTWEPVGAGGRQRPVQPGTLGRVMPAVRLVHSHPARRLSLREAAAACGLSVSQFGYTFRHAMGLSFGKFCMRTRLAYVSRLLLTTDLPVESIAEESGFADASHLHHAFSKVYGCTPARYRVEGRTRREDKGYSVIESTEPEEVGSWTAPREWVEEAKPESEPREAARSAPAAGAGG